jgi:hypothetical protein
VPDIAALAFALHSKRLASVIKPAPPPISEAQRLRNEIRERSVRGIALSLGQMQCSACHGVGQHVGRGPIPALCGCVKRQVFRLVFRHYLWLANQPAVPRYELTENGLVHGLPGVEFRADFDITARRVLNEEQHRIYRYHFLLGADFRVCCRKLAMDRGTFFHAVYRIQQKLGSAFLAMSPSLFPLSEYFRANHEIDPALFAVRAGMRKKWDIQPVHGLPRFNVSGKRQIL